MTLAPAPTRGLSRTAEGRVVPAAYRRLTPLVAGLSVWQGWAAALAITALAGFMRMWRLGYPHKVLFDETYYAKDAWSLWHHGFAVDWVENANDAILRGDLAGLMKSTPEMVVHPELGKWLIGAGEMVFGFTPLGWRIVPAIAGTLLVLVMIRLVRRLTGSDLLGCTAGLLMCFDGLELVLSRLALLDIFLALFLMCAIACLMADRDWMRGRVARALAAGDEPVLRSWRPWRLLAGLMFGLAVSSKWTAYGSLAVFGIWTVLQDAGLRRMLGERRPLRRALRLDAVPAFVSLVVVALVVYVASWSGWIAHAHVYETYLAHNNYGPYWGDYTRHAPHGLWQHLTQGLRSLWHYHQDVWTFHTSGLVDATHVYQSTPEGWPLVNRPVGVDAQLDILPGQQGCAAAVGSTCLRQVILLGTPTLWWAGAAAMVYAAYSWVFRRDWRYGVAVLGFLANWVIWFGSADRPIFFYYAMTMIPFAIVALSLVVGEVIGSPRASARRRTWGTAIAGAFVVLVVANLAWFWPIYTDGLLTHAEWLERIWFTRWI